jgi:hypothetical protein
LTYANAIGLDPQDLQPLTGQPLGTGAQSQVLEEKSKGKGLAAWRQMFPHHMNADVLDDKTTFNFIENDLRDQLRQAEVSKRRGEVSSLRSSAGITTPEQELQVLVDLDELPKQFLPVDHTPGDELSDDEKPEEEVPAAASPEEPPESAEKAIPPPAKIGPQTDALIDDVMDEAREIYDLVHSEVRVA